MALAERLAFIGSNAVEIAQSALLVQEPLGGESLRTRRTALAQELDLVFVRGGHGLLPV